MAVFLALVAAAVGFLSPVLWPVFWNNPGLNGLILFVLAIGIGWNLRQVLRLAPEVAWLEHYRAGPNQLTGAPTARLLAPMARMLHPGEGVFRQDDDSPDRSRPDQSRPDQSRPDQRHPDERRPDRGRPDKRKLTLSSGATRSLLDSLASRLDESRELSRYMTGLLIFLGLLGTFWGLLLTVRSVGDVIGGMSVGSGDINALFEQLKVGLARPLEGMGTAFSSSMLGLAGALVLGFLDLTAGQAQNRFFNELEEWLAGITRLSSGVLGGEGEGGSVPVYVQALLEQTAENMENLQRILARGEDGRREANQAVVGLTEKIATLSDGMRTNQQLMLRIAETQAALAPALQRMGERRGGDHEDATRGHLRNIELLLQRMLSESEQGRTQSTNDLRNDIRLLTRTIAAIAEEQPR
jgi:hypothetical protein